MKKGKREAANGGGWQRGGDPFAEDTPSQAKASGPAKKEKAPSPSGLWQSWSRGKKAGIIILGCAAAVALLVVGWWAMFVRAPDVSNNDRPGVTNNNPSLQLGEQGAADAEENGGALVSGRKDEYYTFLLIGRDTAGGGNTDTLILVSYDVPNGQVNMMSIPRDTAVNVSWSNKKINSVYNAKESSGGGIEGLKQQVAGLTGVMPDFYVIIEWKAVGRIVKAVGGVEFDVPRNMNYDDDYQNLHIHLNKGMQTLNAEQAMAMLRYRNDNADENGKKSGYNDIGRMNTQRDFLKAMAKKVLQLGNITKIGEFIDIFMENVETDLKTTDLMWFASKALGVDLSAMQSSTLPYIDVGRYRGEDYLLPNGPEIVPLINEMFNPYNREISESDLRIIVRNKDGSCSVPGGELLDARWANPASTSAGETGGGVTTTKPTGVVADPNPPSGSNNQTPSTSAPAPADEPVLPDPEGGGAAGTEPGTTPDPDSPDDPGTGETPGSADPSGPSDPGGDTPDPGETDPGPDPQPPDDTQEQPQPDPEPVSDPEDPAPEPELPPEPDLPEE